MTMTLYHCPRTRSERVRWALEELGLEYQLEPVDLHKGEGNGPAFRAINPLGQLPALVIDGEVMLESGAIVHWLADRYGDHRLAPPLESPSRRAYEQWSFFAVTNREEPAWEIVLHRDILPRRWPSRRSSHLPNGAWTRCSIAWRGSSPAATIWSLTASAPPISSPGTF
jgi:glutathione S-transferase